MLGHFLFIPLKVHSVSSCLQLSDWITCSVEVWIRGSLSSLVCFLSVHLCLCFVKTLKQCLKALYSKYSTSSSQLHDTASHEMSTQWCQWGAKCKPVHAKYNSFFCLENDSSSHESRLHIILVIFLRCSAHFFNLNVKTFACSLNN